MKNALALVAIVVSTLTFVGCIRGQFAGHALDPNQVRMIQGANGATEHLILPIKGKPFGCGAQWIFDQIVSAQAGGDIQSITVDSATVEVIYSRLTMGEGLFTMTGKAHITLTQGKGELDAFFREPIQSGCGDNRVITSYGWEFMPEVTAYRHGLATWVTESNAPNIIDQKEAIQAQLSIEMLVREITAEGSVKMDAFNDWGKANQIAWSKRGVLDIQ